MNQRLCQLSQKISRHILQNFKGGAVLTGNGFLNSEFKRIFRGVMLHEFRRI
jgi:hypothetical protein